MRGIIRIRTVFTIIKLYTIRKGELYPCRIVFTFLIKQTRLDLFIY